MNECYYFGHFFLLNLLCFRELGTGGKHLNSILHSSFGPETPAKGPLGMGIPSEINDESPPQRGELQTVLPHFFFFFFAFAAPFATHLALYCRAAWGKEIRGRRGCIPSWGSLGPVCRSPAAPLGCASTCWTTTWRPQPGLAGATWGCPCLRR